MLILEIFIAISLLKVSESIPVKNLRYIYKGISKLGFVNEKIVIECPITAQFYLWKFYQYQAEPQVLLEQEGKFLTMDSVTIDKSGVYECKSTTGFVNAETNITLKIIDPHSETVREMCSISMSPKSRESSKGLCFYHEKLNKIPLYKIGEDAEMDCTAVGIGLKYYWNFIDETGMKTQIHMGYNISKIIVKSVTSQNVGLYKCEVADQNGLKISNSFKVTLSNRASDVNLDIIGDKQDDISTVSGQKINLKCEVKNTFDRIHSLKWGKRIRDSVSYTSSKGHIVSWDQYNYKLMPASDIEETYINQNQILSTLLLPQLDSDHSGVYICLAMDNRGHTVHKIFNLSVSPGYTTTEPSSKSYFFLLYIFLPVILLFIGVCIIIYCCVRSNSQKSNTSLPLKKYSSPNNQNTVNKEPMTSYYYPVANNRPPLPQPNESEASLVSPNTLTSYSSYGNYHVQSANQPSYCSSNGV